MMKTAILAAIAMITAFGGGTIARAQIPGVPGSIAPTPTAPAKSAATRATSSGPIGIDQRVPNEELRGFLARFLPQYPGVRCAGRRCG